MTGNSLRGLCVALLLGTAAVAGANIATVTAAQAATVRPAVGNALKAAIALAGAGKGPAALAKIHEAESVPNLTPSERQTIEDTKKYVAAKTGAGGGAVAAKTKFTADYNAGRYKQAIADAAELRKAGALDFQTQLVVGQAYYLSGDYAGAIRYLKTLGNSQQVLELILSAAYKSGDSEAMRGAAEKLVLAGKTQYWTNLLTSVENTRGLKDHQILDLYRLRFATNNMRNESDYMTAAELALQFGSPSEAVAIIQKGQAAKVLQGNRSQRLLGLANAAVAKDAAGLAAAEKKAAAAKTGDDLVKIGEDLNGQGKYADALTQIQAGIDKGVTDKGNAQMRLGQAYLGAHKKSDAIKAFAEAGNDPAWKVPAHVWSIYAQASK